MAFSRARYEASKAGRHHFETPYSRKSMAAPDEVVIVRPNGSEELKRSVRRVDFRPRPGNLKAKARNAANRSDPANFGAVSCSLIDAAKQMSTNSSAILKKATQYLK